jgi:hypothetical protein
MLMLKKPTIPPYIPICNQEQMFPIFPGATLLKPRSCVEIIRLVGAHGNSHNP